jgi:hypothetical protein
VKVLFVADGKHDIGAPELPVNEAYPAGGVIPVLARNAAPKIEAGSLALRWAEIPRLDPAGKKKGYAAKARAAVLIARRRYGCEGGVFVVDQDGKDEDRVGELKAASTPSFPVACGAAVNSIEAWTLGAPEAIAAELGLKEEAVRAAYPSKHVEDLLETSGKEELRPKGLLERIARLAHRHDGTAFRVAVAHRTDVAALARACPRGFAPFLAELRALFGGPLTTLILCLASVALPLTGCGRSGGDKPAEVGADGGPVALSPQGKVLEAAENEATPAGSARAAGRPAAGPERIDIPSGKFEAGSTPGDKGRDPVLEPAMLEVELGGFTIDRYLYPNDPQKPPLTGVSRSRAQELCQQAGGRLCTELEWERACKGPEGSAYAGGAAWDPACAASPSTCASGFGALGMGAALREWTASDVAPIENMQPKAAAVRGARADAVAADHRCARRAAVDPEASGPDIGFRCCRGAPNAASIPSPQWQQTFRRADIPITDVTDMLASVPQLKDLGGELAFFKEPDDVNIVLARGDAGGPPPNTTFTTSPLLWNPVPGEEILVIAGKAQKDSFIVAFYRLPNDRYRIASSLLLKGEKGPIALAFNGYVRRRLSWSTCWECRGETGNVTYRDDNRVVITQK